MPDRERSYRVETVVLRHSDWGEADRILVLYTREGGKIRAVAKGARKLRSRKAGHLEPFTRVTLMLARGREMPIITQAETVEAYLPLREDLLRTGYAAYVVELLDRFTYEEGENRGLYRLLVDTLERISTTPDPQLAVRYYEIHLLDLLGFRPDLVHCAQCGQEIRPEDQYFSAQLGGVLCPRCGRTHTDAKPVSLNALRFLRHLQRSTFAEAARAKIPAAVQAEMESLLQYYLTYLLERSLNTPAFLRTVRQAGREDQTG
ncbi:MAG TPA: DNA repair protein RecO [Anaerolineaceae bacterium]|nr:DNA repair protein RecO [Anaerolineaceae bacterium]